MTDDSFHITCATCTTRLLVRDASLTGEILACPKCGSMVLVESPESENVPVLPVIPGEIPKDSPTEPLLEPSGAQPSDWVPESSPSLLPKVFAAVGAIGIAGAIGWYAWNRSMPATTIELADESVVEAPVEEEPIVVEETTEVVEELVELDPEEPQDLNLVAEEVDPFQEARSTSHELASIDELHNPELDKPESAKEPQEEPSIDSRSLASLASLLGGDVESTPAALGAPDSETTEVRTSTRLVRDVDVRKLLGRRIRGVQFKRVQLADFVRSFSKISGVTIYVEPAGLEQKSLGLNASVSVEAVNATSMEVLQKALEPLGLMPVIDERVVRITTKQLANKTPTEISLFVGDLLQGSDEPMDLAHFVSTLCEPKTWAVGGGEGTIRVNETQLELSNSRLSLIRVVTFLERMRLARNLPPQSKIPASLRTLDTRWSKMGNRLQRPVDVNAWSETPLSDVLGDFEKQTGLRLLVDWPSLLLEGYSPDTEMKSYLRQTNLADAIARLDSDRSEMVVVAFDSNTAIVTTKSNLRVAPYLEFYRYEDLNTDGQTLVENGMLDGTAALLPSSEYVVISGDAELHRNLTDSAN